MTDIVITFFSPSGPLPYLGISASGLTHSTASVATNVQIPTPGTKEDAVCNNRGRCGESGLSMALGSGAWKMY